MKTEKHFHPDPSEGLPGLPDGVKVHIGHHEGAGRRVGIAAARFNLELTGALVTHAVGTLMEQGVSAAHIAVSWVPGSFELPLALKRLAVEESLDALIACGVVIEGETRHAALIMDSLTPHLHRLSLELGIPVIDAVVSAPTMDLARERCLDGDKNRGVYAALAALECC